MKRALCTPLFIASVFAFSVAVAGGETYIVGKMKLSVSAKLAPKRLPRDAPAPVAVSIGWTITSTDPATKPSTLKTVKIEINRGGLLDSKGLAVCPYGKIQPASTTRALSNCRSSLVGQGSFSALVGLEGQEHYVSVGKMLVFNGKQGGKSVLYGQIYTNYPFAASFVIVFKIDRRKEGTYGTALTASLPGNLRAWGNLTEVQMRLSRRYGFEGHRRSFLSGSCPTPKGVGLASFPLARTSFSFTGGKNVKSTLIETCKVRH